ncbi:MAG: 3-methyl-2-oxobutanoate hydroxymethyltransferase [Clostridia bacterium]
MSKRLSVNDFLKFKVEKRKVSILTAYDKMTARIAEEGGADVLLVGDSLGMTVLGYEDTLSVSMEDMVRHTKAVSNVTNHVMIIADMPFLSYQISVAEALRNAGRLMVEGGCGAVKLEGGMEYCAQVKAITQAGIPVMGHLGFTPQSIHRFGGSFAQGKTEETAVKLMRDAFALEEAGAFAIVLECVPHELAEVISMKLKIPTIGIGSGAECDGQVQVIHDVLGLNDDFQAKHFKKYVEGQKILTDAVKMHVSEVKELVFPTTAHSFTVSSAIIDVVKKEFRG